MDFIQSAIEKARNERAQRASNVPLGDMAAPVPPEAAEGLRADLWASLPEVTPSDREMERHHIHARKRSAAAATFDIMRTKLLHQLRSHNWRRVAITSPTANCGKTTLALNLGFGLARQRDLSCMLLDFDLRRPSMAEMLGLRRPPQFSDVLTGAAEAEERLLRIGDNFALGVNAQPQPDSAELLQRVETGRTVDAIEHRFAPDAMIFDMPPMLLADDALGFIDQIDCVILVAAAGTSSMPEIARCSDELKARCNFLGVVLNMCRFFDSSDAYGYGYGYGYGAGYGYGGGDKAP